MEIIKKNMKPFFRTRPSLFNKLICEAASNTETVQIFKQHTRHNSNEHTTTTNNNNDDDEGNNSNQINETFDDSQNKQKKKSLNNSNLANTLNETKVNADISSRPRNIEQIRNIKRRLARRLVASTDEISELYHFASETPNYIVRFTLIPNVVVVAFSNESMHEFNLLLDYPDLLSQQAAIITFDSS
ncbi:unnamed protein product [Rotaria magnacalcarata]|uniref:Uncharacterized protein n=3 Tax=Rotaria magnacalcarata TaxID=392030 RepID=A0A819NXV8_9BILA|nr:unnamed protein product [Rotaria magnacalcarata]